MKLLWRIVGQGELAGQSFALEQPSLVIGRGQDCDLALPLHGVSRRHAQLQQGPQGWLLTDLGSTNGTLVNGQPIPAHQAYLLQPGDQVAMGSAVLLVQVEEAPEAPAPPGGRPGGKPHPALLVAGAILLVAVLAGIVALLVFALQPREEPATPTPINPMGPIMTLVPTEAQEVLEPIVTLIPTEWLLFPPGPAATPTPPETGSDHRGRQAAICPTSPP